jgi:hypothetical protein
MRIYREDRAAQRIQHDAPRDLLSDAGQRDEIGFDVIISHRMKAIEVNRTLPTFDLPEQRFDTASTLLAETYRSQDPGDGRSPSLRDSIPYRIALPKLCVYVVDPELRHHG